MSSNVRGVGLILACVSGSVHAQQPSTLQVQALATVAPAEFIGVGGGAGVRPTSRTVVLLSGAAGVQAERVAARLEGVFLFQLDPFRQRGLGSYLGAGAAVVVRDGDNGEYVLLVLGVESRPASRSGWFIEAGVGGGLRGALGFRVRRSRR